jgi:MFS transporter, DHA1 family, multidrug resistance protein
VRDWQKNLYTIWVAELIAIMGWGVIQPFLPYFIQDLGVTDLAQVEFYSGLALTVHALAMTISAPFWGVLADRYGRKLMVERSLICGTILYFLMSFVQDVPSLLFIRFLTGALTGTVAAATTLVASSTPRERAGYALGMLQMAIYVGALLGPLMGGVIADAWGYRAAMQVTSGLWLFTTLLVHFMVREEFQPVSHKADAGGSLGGLRLVLASSVLMSIFVVRILTRTGDRVMMPVMSLFIQSLLEPGAPVASITGLVTGAAAGASAAGAVLLGRVSDRFGSRNVLLVCITAAAVAYVPHFFVADVVQLTALQLVVSFFLGGTLTTVSTLLAGLAPEGRQGAVYGLDTSAASVGNAVGPMLGAGIAMSLGIRSGFLFVAGFFLIAAVAVARLVPRSSAPAR